MNHTEADLWAQVKEVSVDGSLGSEELRFIHIPLWCSVQDKIDPTVLREMLESLKYGIGNETVSSILYLATTVLVSAVMKKQTFR